MSIEQNWINLWHDYLETHPVLNLDRLNFQLPKIDDSIHAGNETFWEQVQQLFPQPSNHINLNNGGVCSNTNLVEEAFKRYYTLLNTSPSYFTWQVMESGRQIIKEGLAAIIHGSAQEIALFRNASEALNNAIFGIPLSAGDEIVACQQDYVKCVSSWKQRAMREGIKINWVELNGHETNEEVIQKYISLFSENTKVLHLTQVINWNGQILPIEPIIDAAKKRNILVLLDAAHSFAVLDIDVKKLDIDYMGVALHKWLSGPIAGGMLYIKSSCIESTWPLASAIDPTSPLITKFEEMSIQLMPNMISLGFAIEFHFKLTQKLKFERLQYLRKHWTNAFVDEPKMHFKIPLNDKQCGAIATFNIEGYDPLVLQQKLFNDFQIHVAGFMWPNLSGIRITPNIYTPLKDIDKLIQSLQEICRQK